MTDSQRTTPGGVAEAEAALALCTAHPGACLSHPHHAKPCDYHLDVVRYPRATPSGWSRLDPMKDLRGIPVVQSPALVIVQPRRRSWRERLFTRPWRPLQRMEMEHVPDPKIYEVRNASGAPVLLMHPETWRRLRLEAGR